MPAEAFGPLPRKHRLSRTPSPVRDFRRAPAGNRPENADHQVRRRFESHPQLLGLYTGDDGPLSWMRAGQALQRVLLRATHRGLAASFLTQPLETYDNRMRYEHSLTCPPPFTYAQMIMRVGHSRPTGPATVPRATWTSVFAEESVQAHGEFGVQEVTVSGRDKGRRYAVDSCADRGGAGDLGT